ncbi:CobW family GTP-binding protein [Billgrantia endophytica]|uniref:Cobalamin biosynthesis protein CobW n=1 Tax=Billgrantia endophytica TaxID=2033802 RepID=A0A2N7UEH8_9GAMM|nr:GTP-binding protein [Halomonas endophytica]PMR78791.1 cobalamin biosynthesis protein CobW [Halomonas endophytica]
MSRLLPDIDYGPLPVVVLTGFLGSGKTTLLRRLLAEQPLGETALLINEVGEVGIDHRLVTEVAPETRLLPSGCVCCSIRGELKEALLELLSLRQTGRLPPFSRIVLETTGLADPAPVLATLSHDPQLRHHFGLARTVTLVDALNAPYQEGSQPEWLAQVAAADLLLLGKDDLVDEMAGGALLKRLGELNPTAERGLAAQVASGDPRLLPKRFDAGPGPRADGAQWPLMLRRAADTLGAAPGVSGRHARIVSFVLEFDASLEWDHFALWLSLLLNAHGDKVLRVKGILNLGPGEPPVALHGVQHVLHPPQHLAAWPDDDRRSLIVFITRGLAKPEIEHSLRIFLAALGTPVSERRRSP